MLETTIIGAGVAGLALGNRLRKQGITFNGIEKEAKFGGRVEFGHQRLYTKEAQDFLIETLPDLEWTETTEEAVQVNKKGEFGALSEDFESAERFYLNQPFLQPTTSYSSIVTRLQQDVGDAFRLRSTVTHVELENRQITLLNGAQEPFKKLIWTGSFASLLKVTGETPKGLPKKGASPIETGGITWDIEVNAPLFPNRNTVVFPFRYKDLKLRALGIKGIVEAGSTEKYHWSLFLEDSLLENREELAKIVRAFKRELGKQFPELEKSLVKERLAFHPSLSGELPVSMPSLEVFEGVVCVGPDIQTEEVARKENRRDIRNLDRVLGNCLDFVDLVLPRWLEKPMEQGQASTENSVSV